MVVLARRVGVWRLGWLDLYEYSVCVCVGGGYVYVYDVCVVGKGGQDRGLDL